MFIYIFYFIIINIIYMFFYIKIYYFLKIHNKNFLIMNMKILMKIYFKNNNNNYKNIDKDTIWNYKNIDNKFLLLLLLKFILFSITIFFINF